MHVSSRPGRAFAGYDEVIFVGNSARFGSFDAIGGRFACQIILFTSKVQSVGMRTRLDLLILTACTAEA